MVGQGGHPLPQLRRGLGVGHGVPAHGQEIAFGALVETTRAIVGLSASCSSTLPLMAGQPSVLSLSAQANVSAQ